MSVHQSINGDNYEYAISLEAPLNFQDHYSSSQDEVSMFKLIIE